MHQKFTWLYKEHLFSFLKNAVAGKVTGTPVGMIEHTSIARHLTTIKRIEVKQKACGWAMNAECSMIAQGEFHEREGGQ